jgi:hypothetical protein
VFERPEGFWESDVFHAGIVCGAFAVRPIGSAVVGPPRQAMAGTAGAFRNPRVWRRIGRDRGDPVGAPPLWVGTGRERADLTEPVYERPVG